MSITHPVFIIHTSHSLHFLDKLALIEFTPIHYTHPIILHTDLGLLLRPCAYVILQISRLIQQSGCLGRINPLVVPLTITLQPVHDNCTGLSKTSPFSLPKIKSINPRSSSKTSWPPRPSLIGTLFDSLQQFKHCDTHCGELVLRNGSIL